MYRSVWDWLEIDPTNDKKEIKRAYAQMAKKYHPTEHPEEFQKLRDAYRTAMDLADRDIKLIEEDEDEYEEEYDFDECLEDEEDEEDEEYDFDECSENDAEPEYEFDVDREDYQFSNRQTVMLSFYETMLEVFMLDPQEYRADGYYEAVFKPWMAKPYADELTPGFISALLDKLYMGCLFHPAFYRVIKKVFFKGKDGEEFGKLKLRIEALEEETKLYKWEYEGFPAEKNTKEMFFRGFDDSTPVYLGYLMEEGLSRKYPLRRFYFDKGVLFLAGWRFKYFFICDLSCTINRKNGDITVHDVCGKKIFTMPSTHKKYHYVLRQLTEGGCTADCADECDLKTYTADFVAEPFHKLIFDGRLNRIMNGYLRKTGILVLAIPLLFVIFTCWSYLYRTDFLDGRQLLFWLILGYGNILAIIFGSLYLAILIVVDLIYFIRFFVVIPIYHTLQKECESENGVYDLGNRLFVFKDHVFYPKETELIPIKQITTLEILDKKEMYGDGYLNIGFNHGAVREYFVGNVATAEALYKEIKNRMD